ncbi:MAG TPA: nuclear transport factor 2 family protein [Acidimicrobiales bacterium]
MANVDVVQGLWSAVHERDWEGVARHLADDAVYYDVPTGPATAAKGPAGIVARLRLGLGDLAGYEHRPGVMAADGDTVLFEHSETWTWPTGETVTLPFVTVHRVVGDRVTLWRDYWDYETLRRGAPPDWEARLMAADVASWLYDATGEV